MGKFEFLINDSSYRSQKVLDIHFLLFFAMDCSIVLQFHMENQGIEDWVLEGGDMQ